MTAADTLFSFAHPWECDEVDHLNIQFYFARFEEADRQFRQMTGLSEALVGGRRTRHVRFLREIKAGDLLTIRSSVALDGPHILTVVHELLRSEDGTVCATALDGYAPQQSAVKTLRTRFKEYLVAMPDEAAPRGLSASPISSRHALADLKKQGSCTTYRSTVQPRDITLENRVDDAYAAGCFTLASPHLWQSTPLTTQYLKTKGAGRVVLEMKICWVSPLKAGDMVQVESALTATQASSFTLRHHLYESRTNRLAAVCDVVTGMLDLENRRLITLDDQIRRSMGEAVLN